MKSKPLSHWHVWEGLFAFIDMQGMEQAVGDRGEHDAGNGNEKNPGKKGVKAGKQFACSAVDMVDRSHPAENHGGIDGGINPAEVCGDVIADNSQCLGDANQCDGYGNMAHHALHKALL